MAPLESKIEGRQASTDQSAPTLSWVGDDFENVNSDHEKQIVESKQLESTQMASNTNEIKQLNSLSNKNYGTIQHTNDFLDKDKTKKKFDSFPISTTNDDKLDKKQFADFRSYDIVRDNLTKDKNKRTEEIFHSVQVIQNGNNNNSSNSTETNTNQMTVLERIAKVIPCFGIILALCASVSLGTAGMLVKLTRSVSGIQVAVLRSLIQIIIYACIISYRRLKIFPEKGEWFPVFGRAWLGAASMCFTYYALNLSPLGDVTAIRFSLPIWTLIVSYFFLKEPCYLSKIFAVFIAITGVLLIAKPDDFIYLGHMMFRLLGAESAKEFDIHKHEHEEARQHELDSLDLHTDQTTPNGTLETFWGVQHFTVLGPDERAKRQLTGCMLALASSILLSLSLIALRLAKKTPAEITIFWLSVLSVLIGNFMLLCLNEWALPNNWLDLFYILMNGLAGSAGQWFITSALKIEQSGLIALTRTFDIEVAFMYSALILHEDIKTTSIIGAIFVSLAVIIVVVPRWLDCASVGAQETSNDENGSNKITPTANYGSINSSTKSNPT